MIAQLTHSNSDIASHIYAVFQASYKIEAALIGTNNFPPLSRTPQDIASSNSLFYGFYKGDSLAGVIEITYQDNLLEIDSLTVAPEHFRKGIAGKLMEYVLNAFDFSKATVETAVVNAPSIRLYQKHDFNEFKRFTPSHGIEKVALALDLSS
ncbi:GNAT family N-acetyltransferase [Pseudoalteromonas spongiae]|uniref:GNAT family N-acetyltransferase n=1 Tax=Pseudoalteromonas spongiae TaxID=298657 RepID=A0ABU8EWH6_9GAMM